MSKENSLIITLNYNNSVNNEENLRILGKDFVSLNRDNFKLIFTKENWVPTNVKSPCGVQVLVSLSVLRTIILPFFGILEKVVVAVAAESVTALLLFTSIFIQYSNPGSHELYMNHMGDRRSSRYSHC